MKQTLLLLLLPSLLRAQKEQWLIAGTYNSPKSEGIYVYRFNPADGSTQYVSHINSSNPSYLAVSPDQRYVYAVNEDDTGSVSAYRFDKTSGSLQFINRRSSAGRHPCYIAVDKTGRWVAVGNYSSGSLAIFPVQKDGGLDSAAQVIEHAGYSVNEARQQGPHVHATVFSPDNRFLLVPDLGIDKLMIYAFDEKTGSLSPAEMPFEITEPGAGPRHLDFHPSGRYVYLMEELSGSISVYAYAKGSLQLLQNISALPGDYGGPVGSADIHVSPDGKFLYASNRGESNTLAIFAIHPKNGQLSPLGHQPTLGRTPRHFTLEPAGNYLLAGNQNSDEIVVFRRDKKTGLLTDTGTRVKLGKPVCMKWVKAK